MTITEAFGAVADNLAQAAPEKIIGLKAPTSMSLRVEELVFRRKDGLITTDEAAELERFMALDLFINLSKARARLLLQTQ